MADGDDSKYGMHPCDMEIGQPSIDRDVAGTVTVTYAVTSTIFPDKLFFKINAEYEGLVDQSLNCALVGLILPAMRSGSRLILNGPVSERLLTACKENLQAVVGLVLGYETIPIVLNGEFTDRIQAEKTYTATGFSAGVDSYSVLNDHYFKRDSTQSGINYLVFNNVGANGTTAELDLFEKRLAEAKRGAEAVGLPLIVIESNMDDFYSVYDDLHFFKTHTFRNASVAHLLSNSISNYLYAAARTYSDVRVMPSETLGNVDPITLPLLSSEILNIQSEGAQYKRSEKIAAISDLKAVQNNLFVCVHHNHPEDNCSVCQKCVRTLLVIECQGRLEDFSNVFDLDNYHSVKYEKLVKIIAKNDSFGRDIKRLIYDSNMKIPLAYLVKANFLLVYGFTKTKIKLIKKLAVR